MKNSLFKAATLCLSVAVLGACSKDKTTGSNLNAGSSSPAKNPIEQLRTFKRQIESVKAHPEERTGETITLSEALWDIENTFNLNYSDAEQYYGQINNHEFTLALPVAENQEVLVYDAVNLYSEVVSQARAALVSDTFDEKGVVSLTIKEVEDYNGSMRITFTGKTGERSNYNPPIAHVDGPFGVDDNWMFAAPLGKCDDPDIPSGADEQLQEHLFAELIEPYTDAGSGYRNIYVNRLHFTFDGTNYTNLYYATGTDDMCIDHIYLNDYYYAEKTIISRTIPEQYHLEGYSPISIEIKGNVLTEPSALTHKNEIEYGIRLRVSTDEFGETKDLMTE
jgi:hypothetical protein